MAERGSIELLTFRSLSASNGFGEPTPARSVEENGGIEPLTIHHRHY